MNRLTYFEGFLLVLSKFLHIADDSPANLQKMYITVKLVRPKTLIENQLLNN